MPKELMMAFCRLLERLIIKMDFPRVCVCSE
jgi:hypothetical protein